VTPQELTATTVLRMAITEGAAPSGRGVLPVHGAVGAPLPDRQVAPTTREPESLSLTQFGFRPRPVTRL